MAVIDTTPLGQQHRSKLLLIRISRISLMKYPPPPILIYINLLVTFFLFQRTYSTVAVRQMIVKKILKNSIYSSTYLSIKKYYFEGFSMPTLEKKELNFTTYEQHLFRNATLGSFYLWMHFDNDNPHIDAAIMYRIIATKAVKKATVRTFFHHKVRLNVVLDF